MRQIFYVELHHLHLENIWFYLCVDMQQIFGL